MKTQQIYAIPEVEILKLSDIDLLTASAAEKIRLNLTKSNSVITD